MDRQLDVATHLTLKHLSMDMEIPGGKEVLRVVGEDVLPMFLPAILFSLGYVLKFRESNT